jgi:mycothiol system anti-sigma-R factor
VVQVRSHLEACGGCTHQYQFEESLRRLVRVRCQEQGAPDSLKVRVTMSWAIERQRLEQEKRRPLSGA